MPPSTVSKQKTDTSVNNNLEFQITDRSSTAVQVACLRLVCNETRFGIYAGGNRWCLSSSLSFLVGFSIQNEVMDVAQSLDVTELHHRIQILVIGESNHS